jgi:hypothetical protein
MRPPKAYLIFIAECDPKNKFCIDANDVKIAW